MIMFDAKTAIGMAKRICQTNFDVDEDVGYAICHLLLRVNRDDWGDVILFLMNNYRDTERKLTPPDLEKMSEELWEETKASVGALIDELLLALMDGHLDENAASCLLTETFRDLTDEERIVVAGIVFNWVAPYEHLPEQLFKPNRPAQDPSTLSPEYNKAIRQLRILSYRTGITLEELWRAAMALIFDLEEYEQARAIAQFHEFVMIVNSADPNDSTVVETCDDDLIELPQSPYCRGEWQDTPALGLYTRKEWDHISYWMGKGCPPNCN